MQILHKVHSRYRHSSLHSLRNSKTASIIVPRLLFYRLLKDRNVHLKDLQIITIHSYSENQRKVTISPSSILNLVHRTLTHSFNQHVNNISNKKFNKFRVRILDKIGNNKSRCTRYTICWNSLNSRKVYVKQQLLNLPTIKTQQYPMLSLFPNKYNYNDVFNVIVGKYTSSSVQTKKWLSHYN